MENSKDMAQHTYDNEAVQELLNWAKKMIETKNYPTERYQVNKCTTIIDGKSYLESLIAMISRNWENPTFHPTNEALIVRLAVNHSMLNDKSFMNIEMHSNHVR